MTQMRIHCVIPSYEIDVMNGDIYDSVSHHKVGLEIKSRSSCTSLS